MIRSRRGLLGALATGWLTLAGCLDRAPTTTPGTSEPPTTGARRTQDEPTEPTTEQTPRETRGPVRGEADPITVDRTITDQDVEYLPDEDAVKYVAGHRRVGTPGDGPPTSEPVYETIPFEDWAATECASVGARAVASHVSSRVDGDPGAGFGINPEGDGLAITVSLETTLDRDGNVVFGPSVEFEQVVEATPSEATVTVELAEREQTETIPVWVREEVIRQE